MSMEQQFAKTAYWNCLSWGVLSSMSVTICTIVDAALIGNFVSDNGLAVVGIATPVFMLFAFFGVTVAVGANVLIGQALGAGDRRNANLLMGKQLFIGILLGLLLLVGSLCFQNRVITFLGAQDTIFLLAKAYLLPVFIASPLFVLYHILSMSVRTDGNSRLAAITAGVVIVTNLLLDFLLMGYFDWGIRGASVSLCVAELLGTALLLTHFGRKLSILRLGISIPRFADWQDFARNGFGVGSAYVFQALVMLVFNKLLLSDEVNGVMYESIFGVFYTVSTIPQAFFDGAGGALAPVVSIFAGEQDARSILIVLRQGTIFIIIVSLLFFGLFLPCAAPILAAFSITDAALATATPVFRLFSVSFLFSGINILLTDFWQTVGRARLAGAMSILRNFVVILIFGVILIPRFQITGLAAAYICTELFCFAMILVISVVSPSKAYVKQCFSPVGRVFEKYYSICTESVGDISADIERICDEWEIFPKQAFFLNFITEEILLNIIKFGLKDGAGQHYIDIKLLEGEDAYTLRIRDNVKAFDPFVTEGDSIDNAVLQMIRNRAKNCEYQRKLIFNYLYLVI